MTIATDIFTPKYRKLMEAFPLREIRTVAEMRAATKILDEKFSDTDYEDPGEEQYVRALTVLLGDYEDKHGGPDEATGLDVLKELMEQHGMKAADLARTLEISQPAVSMVLKGVRRISREQSLALAKVFGLPNGVFLNEVVVA